MNGGHDLESDWMEDGQDDWYWHDSEDCASEWNRGKRLLRNSAEAGLIVSRSHTVCELAVQNQSEVLRLPIRQRQTQANGQKR